MKILIIEDDTNKAMVLLDFVRLVLPRASLLQAFSYQSGLKSALVQRPDVIVLDMSMPTYDIGVQEKGGATRPFAGREILGQLKRKNMRSQCIIVTQFESFGAGDQVTTLRELTLELRDQYPENFIATVSYQASDSAWQTQLQGVLLQCLDRLKPRFS